MQKKVMISLKGSNQMDQSQQIEFVTEGTLQKENSQLIVSYQESPMTGMEGTKTTLEISTDTVTMKRVGTINTEFIFKQGNRSITHYSTEYGVFTIGINPIVVKIDMDEHGGELDIQYELDANNQKNKNFFQMKIREVE